MRQTCESERENGGNNDAERERTSESEIEDLGAQLDKACASRPLDLYGPDGQSTGVGTARRIIDSA